MSTGASEKDKDRTRTNREENTQTKRRKELLTCSRDSWYMFQMSFTSSVPVLNSMSTLTISSRDDLGAYIPLKEREEPPKGVVARRRERGREVRRVENREGTAKNQRCCWRSVHGKSRCRIAQGCCDDKTVRRTDCLRPDVNIFRSKINRGRCPLRIMWSVMQGWVDLADRCDEFCVMFTKM